MSKKNLFYNNDNNSTNIENVVDIDDIKIGYHLYKGSIDYGFLTITHDVFNNIKNKIVWPTFTPFIDKNIHTEYLGAIIIKTNLDKYVIACLINTIYDNCVHVEPNIELIQNCSYTCFPNRNVKCFETKEEYEADITKKQKKFEGVPNKFIPTFNFITPKFKILEIYSKTSCASNIKIGDILHSEIPVIKTNENRPIAMLNGSSATDYVDIYVNGECVKTISPIVFQNMFFFNFKVEQVE